MSWNAPAQFLLFVTGENADADAIADVRGMDGWKGIHI